MMKNTNFIIMNIIILFASLFILSILIPNFTENLFNQYNNREIQSNLKNENIGIDFFQSFKAPISGKIVLMYDQTHGTNLSAKLVTPYETTSSAVITSTQLQNIKQVNSEKIKSVISPCYIWSNYIEPALIWIILTCLGWVTNNFLDSLFKKNKKT